MHLSIGRTISILLSLAFVAVAFYAYTTIPATSSTFSTSEHVFLLDAAIGVSAGLLYSGTRGAAFRLSPKKDLAYDLRVPSIVAGAVIAGALAYTSFALKDPIYAVFSPALLVFVVLAARRMYPLSGKASFAPLTEDRMVKFVTSRDRLKRLAEYRAHRFAAELARSGQIGNPYVLAAKSVTGSLVAAAVAVPVSVVLSALVYTPLVMVAFLPVYFYVSPELKLRDKANQRREGVDRELPFFSILVNVLGSAGVSLYDIFTGIIDTKIFSAIRSEALLLKRDVVVFGTDPNQALERLASTHPSRKFSTLLNGYSAKVRSGGDIPLYLQGESGSLLRELEESWSQYAQRSGIIGSMMITLFGVVPLLLLIVGFFSSAFSVVSLLAFTAVGVPLLTVLLVLMAGRMQPVGEEPLKGAGARSMLFALPGLGLGLVSGQLWLSAASFLFLFLTIYGVSVRDQRREAKEVDEALPEFMKDMMEFKRQEYDLTKSVLAIAAHNKYNPTFDKLLSQTASQLRSGTPMNEVTVDPRTRLARMVFFVLGQMGYSGGGTVETTYQLSVYTGKVVEMKKNAQAEMRPYIVLSYFTPVLLAFGVAFVGGILSGLSGSLTSSAQAAGIRLTGVFHPELFQVADVLIAGSAAALGVVGAKMTDFTVKNTSRASVNVVIAVVATYIASGLNLGSLLHIAL